MSQNKAVADIAYDAYLVWGATNSCNLHCAYCSVGEQAHQGDNLTKINIPVLVDNLDRTGLTFCIDFCGYGETFFINNLIEACQKITKNHYVALVSNLTLPQVKDFAQQINPGRVLRITASAHLKELENRNLFHDYFENFLFLRNRGFNVSAMAVAYPSLSEETERYKKKFQDQGIDLGFETFVGEYGGKKYPQAYSRQELTAFGLTAKQHYRYGKICNAGYNIARVSEGGEIASCPRDSRILGNIYDKINFRKKPTVCPFEFCGCPGNAQTRYLLDQTLKKISLNEKIFLYVRFLARQLGLSADNLSGKIGFFLSRHFPRLCLTLKKIGLKK